MSIKTILKGLHEYAEMRSMVPKIMATPVTRPVQKV